MSVGTDRTATLGVEDLVRLDSSSSIDLVEVTQGSQLLHQSTKCLLTRSNSDLELRDHPIKTTDLPYDVIHKIFETAGVATSTCLGLTSTKLYAFLKTYRPKVIGLREGFLTKNTSMESYI